MGDGHGGTEGLVSAEIEQVSLEMLFFKCELQHGKAFGQHGKVATGLDIPGIHQSKIAGRLRPGPAGHHRQRIPVRLVARREIFFHIVSGIGVLYASLDQCSQPQVVQLFTGFLK